MPNKSLALTIVGLIASACALLAAPLAVANDHSRVNWSINVGTPYAPPIVYGPPPVVYVQPQPVYVQPAPVYVRPYPVYVAPTPVVEYRYNYSGQPYYGRPYYQDGYRREKHWKHHRHDD